MTILGTQYPHLDCRLTAAKRVLEYVQHGGVSATVVAARHVAWVTKAWRSASKVVNSCNICKLKDSEPKGQLSGLLQASLQPGGQV